MTTLNQLESGCFLFKASTFRLQTEQTLKQKIFTGFHINIDGLYTHADSSYTVDYKGNKQYNARHGGNNIYDQRNLTLLIDGTILHGKFIDMFNNRIHYYCNNKNSLSLLTISLVEISDETGILNAIYTKSRISHNSHFSLIINTPLPNIDMIATKLASY